MEGGADRKLVELRDRALMAQQRFWRHQDQRFADVALQLTPQDVKIIGGRRAIRHLHIVLGAQLQIAFEPRRGMFRPLAFVAMRQEADETRHPQPFAFAGRNELIEHDLRAIGEIAELSFPNGQGIGFG